MKNLAEKARTILCEYGYEGLGYRAAQRVLEVLPFGVAEWFDIFSTRTAVSDDKEVIKPQWIDHTESLAMVDRIGWMADKEEPRINHAPLFGQRLREGMVMAVAFDGDDPMGYLWFAPVSKWDENGVVIKLEPKECWAIDGFTFDKYRGQQVHSRLFLGAAREMRAIHGFNRIISTVDVMNEASQQSAMKRGATRLIRIMHLRLGPVSWTSGRGFALGPVEFVP
jgi:hypothetical protein